VSRLHEYVPGSRAGWVFALSALVDSSGTGLYLAGSAIFFVRSVGLTNAQIGIGLTVGAAVGLATSVPLGLIGQRIGARQLLVILQVARAAGMVALAFCTSFPWFVLISAWLAIAQGATGPMTQAVAGAVSDTEDRNRTMAVVRSTRNLGLSLGGLMTLTLLATGSAWGYRLIILGDGLSFIVSALLVLRLPLSGTPEVSSAGNPFKLLSRFRNRRYLWLTGLNGVLVFHSTLLSVGIPLAVVQASRAPAELVPALTMINTVMVVVMQVRFARSTHTLPGATRALRLGGTALAACCVTTSFTQHVSRAPSIALFIVAIMLLSTAELWQSAGSWEVSYRYAPEDQWPVYLSVFFLGINAEPIVGPIVVADLVVGRGPAGWLALAALFCVASILVKPLLSGLERALPATPAGHEPATPAGHEAAR
jgi:predicted MFS family arabinose efflux permease